MDREPQPVVSIPVVPTAHRLHGDETRLGVVGENSVEFFDLSIPTAPDPKGVFSVPNTRDLVIQGEVRFLVHSEGLITLDLTDLNEPLILDSVDFPALIQIQAAGRRHS